MSILDDRRRRGLPPELLARVFIAWAAICVILLAINIGGIAAMRQPAAEIIAVVAVPLITFGMALLLVGRLVWRLVGEEAAGIACLAMALSVPVVSQFMPLRIDALGWQIVLALAAANGLMARSSRRGGWTVGVSPAIWLSISIEALPMAAAFGAIAVLRWLRNRQESGWLVYAMQGLAVGSLPLFLGARGLGALASVCDAISPVHCAMFAFGAAGATLLARLEPMPRFMLALGLGSIAAGALAIMWSAAPQCPTGFGSLPVWRQSPDTAIQIVIPPLIGILACLRLAGRSGDWLRRWWFEYALLLGCALAMAVFASSAGAVAGALAAVPLGWQIREWMRSARTIRRRGRKVLAGAAIVLALLPAFPLTLLTFAMPAQAAQLLRGDEPRNDTAPAQAGRKSIAAPFMQ